MITLQEKKEMANNEPFSVELSPYFKERILSSIRAIVGCIIGIIVIAGAIILLDDSTVAQFVIIFSGGVMIFITTWRILRIATVKLYVNTEEIRYRDRFLWERISWSDIISVGRANDIETKDHDSVLKRIKSMVFLTDSGVKHFDMSSYSLTHGLEIVNKVIDARPKKDDEEEIEEEQLEFVE